MMLFSRFSRLLNRHIAAGLKLLRNDYTTDPSVSAVQITASVPDFNPLLHPEHTQHVHPVNSPISKTSLSLNIQNNLYHPRKQILDLPLPAGTGIFRLPTNVHVPHFDDDVQENIIDAPPADKKIEKRAARLIVIRRRKMKKHKLKKLRKKMKFEWAKVRQRREMRKEKAFQAQLIGQIKEAEAFDAAKYVAEKLRKAQEKPLPKKWKGRRLPAFLIKEKLGIKD